MNSIVSQDTSNFLEPNSKSKRALQHSDSIDEIYNPLVINEDEGNSKYQQQQQYLFDERRRTTNRNKNSLLVIDEPGRMTTKNQKNLQSEEDQQLIYNFNSSKKKQDRDYSNSQELSPDVIPIHTTSNGMHSSSSQFGLPSGNGGDVYIQQQREIYDQIQKDKSKPKSHMHNGNPNLNPQDYQKMVDQDADRSMVEAKKKKKKRRLIIGGIIALILLGILGLVLGLALNRSSPSPHPILYTPTSNPYTILNQASNPSYGLLTYVLSTNRSMHQSVRVEQNQDNYLFKAIKLSSQSLQYGQQRLTLSSNSSLYAQDLPEYQQFGDIFNGKDFDKNYKKGISNKYQRYVLSMAIQNNSNSTNSTKQEQIKNKQEDIQEDNVEYYWKYSDRESNTDLFTTQGQQLNLMRLYSQMGFKMNTTKLLGLGRSENSSQIFLQSGNYSIDPLAFGELNQTINNTKISAIFFPLIIAMLNSSQNMAIYVRSNYALQIEVKINTTENTTIINIMSAGPILDLHFFVEKNLVHLISKIQQIVGTPKMLPFWSQGLFMKGFTMNNASQVLNYINSYQQNGISLQGFAFTKDAYENGQLLQMNELISQLRIAYPNIQLLLPFTHEVANNFSMSNNNQPYYYIEDELLQIYYRQNGQTYQGYCLDPFNPNSTLFIQNVLQSISYQSSSWGLWLESNYPKIEGYVKDINSFDSVYKNIPYQPVGTNINQEQTLSYGSSSLVRSEWNATSNEANQFFVNFFEVQAIFGSMITKRLIDSAKIVGKKPPFVISESIGMGMSQYGVAFNYYNSLGALSYDALRGQIVDLINFGIIGQPYVLPLQCQSIAQVQNVSNTTDETLCYNFYKIGVISPLQIMQGVDTQYLDILSQFNSTQIKSVKNLMTQRMQYLVYQRSELYKIKLNGGSLIRPLVFDYPDVANPQDLSIIQFGDSIITTMSLNFNQSNGSYSIPDYQLIDLETMETYHTYYNTPLSMTVNFSPDKLNMFQKGTQTIVAFQNLTGRQINKVEDLKSVPLTLSVSLEGGFIGDLFNLAKGQVYVEQGFEEDGLTEHFEIKAEGNIISIKQQNSGQASSTKSGQLEKIYVSFVNSGANTACALLNDMDTIQTLYVSSYNSTRKQLVIQPNDPSKPSDQTTLSLNQVAYIFFGQSDHVCDKSLFGLSFDSVLVDTDTQLQIKVNQKIKGMIGNNIPPLYFNITLLTDNSLYFRLSSLSIYYSDTLSQIYDRNFSYFSNIQKQFKIRDIVSYNQEPFYLTIVNPKNKKQVLFSTKDKIIFEHIDINLFNFEQPSSNPDQAYGLGERKGSFYLQDQTTYSLFNNDNSLEDLQMSQGRVRVLGKNGYFPVMYSQLQTGGNSNAFMLYNLGGVDLTYFKQADKKSPRVCIQLQNTNPEFTFFFNLIPSQASQYVHSHLKLGTLLNESSLLVNNKYLPPLEFMYGSFLQYKNLNQSQGVQDYISKYFSATNQWPIEGIVMDLQDLEDFDSLTFNQTLFWSLQDDLYYLKTQGLKLLQVSKTGFPTYQSESLKINDGVKLKQSSFLQSQNHGVKSTFSNKYTKYILENGAQIIQQTTDNPTQYGYDEQYQVIYADYSNSITSSLVSSMITDFKSSYQLDASQFGVQLKRNEITNPFCSQSGLCYMDEYNSGSSQWFGKPGTISQSQNSLPYVALRSIGKEHFYHNAGGLLEQIQYANALGSRSPPLISDSNALGSGHLGLAGRVQKYFNFTQEDVYLAVQQLQTMNLIGMPLTSIQFDLSLAKNLSDLSTQSLISQIILLNSYSPLKVLDIDLSQDTAIYNFSVLPFDHLKCQRVKYMLLKHQRTQHYLYLNEGKALVQPAFSLFSSDTNTLNLITISSQFMIGDQLIVKVQDLTSNSQSVYLPNGLWCAISYLRTKTDCVLSRGQQVQAPQMGDLLIYQISGTIITLQNTISRNVTNTRDLQQNYPIDLHILIDPKQSSSQTQASGRILVHGFDPFYNGFCDLQLIFSSDTLTIIELNSDQLGPPAQPSSLQSQSKLHDSGGKHEIQDDFIIYSR